MGERHFWRLTWLLMRVGWRIAPHGWAGCLNVGRAFVMFTLSRYFGVRWGRVKVTPA